MAIFVDGSFIFLEASRLAPASPSLGIYGTCPGRGAGDFVQLGAAGL